MLDNVLEVTAWPLEPQRQEAMAKRRVGSASPGWRYALIMLRLKYDTDEARGMAARISEAMRDRAYQASDGCSRRERGAFPLFNADLYLSGHQLCRASSRSIKEQIKKSGIRNSHLLSIAPTGTISLAFRRQCLERHRAAVLVDLYAQEAHGRRHAAGVLVEDHAWRRYRAAGGEADALPPYFVTALEISARSHEQMVATVAPTSTPASRRPSTCGGLSVRRVPGPVPARVEVRPKGLATYRPNKILRLGPVGGKAAGLRP